MWRQYQSAVRTLSMTQNHQFLRPRHRPVMLPPRRHLIRLRTFQAPNPVFHQVMRPANLRPSHHRTCQVAAQVMYQVTHQVMSPANLRPSRHRTCQVAAQVMYQVTSLHPRQTPHHPPRQVRRRRYINNAMLVQCNNISSL
jgi:hypothetical protein